jgi:hypothetical protein
VGGEDRALTLARGAALLAIAAAVALSVTSDAVAREKRPTQCDSLAGLQLPNVEILRAVPIEAGSYASPDEETYTVPALCRVYGEARPTSRSRINFELWMPASGWTGRYYQLGTGGFGGRIHYPSLAAEVRTGNAVASTDTGHSGTPFDASWARGEADRIIDYGYRSLAATSDAARTVIRAYYRRPAHHRYFVGCSNGGRQALMVAERYPRDWDGILAGAPATTWTRHLAGFASIQHALRSSPSGWLPTAKLAAVQRAALRSCEAKARVVDGVPADPRYCRLEPASLECHGEETDDCLTAAQIASLREILRRGFEPTAAAYAGSWEHWIVNPDARAQTQRTLTEEFFRHMVTEDPAWSLERFDPARDLPRVDARRIRGELLTRVLDPGTDLRPFARRGGKLVMYFGWADALISPYAAIDYYERAAAHAGGIEAARKFFRLFMVPGMTHCQGGLAPHAFGQAPIAPALRPDARHDIRRALEDWVERGVAPERIVAAKYFNDDPKQGVAATRTLCPFPQPADCGQKEEG